MGVGSFSFISKLESGEQNNPTLDTIVRFDCLGFNPELMGWDALSPYLQSEADWETLKDRPVEFVYRVIQTFSTVKLELNSLKSIMGFRRTKWKGL